MKVVAFHTGGPYQEEADRLIKSLEWHDIDYHVQKIDIPTADWDVATSIKPIFLLEMRERFKGNILYVDVDAVFHQNPSEYFDSLDCDFAAHWFQGPNFGRDFSRNDDWFLSGTMMFADTEPARELLRTWCEANEKKQAAGDYEGGGQTNLRDILDKNLGNLLDH